MSMKRILAIAFALAVPGALVAADTASVTYRVDPQGSRVTWLAKKVTGRHHGTVPVQSGELTVAGGALTGGVVTIATAKLADEDLLNNPKSKANLESHLNSRDFFDTAACPTSSFRITSVKALEKPTDRGDNVRITGDLTIKNKTNPLTFPANVTVTGDTVTATAEKIRVDRTVYGIRYGAGKFFQGMGDKVINNDFWIDVSLVATK